MSIAEIHNRPGHLIRRCQQIAVGLFLDRCAEFDLTPVQYAVLRTVHVQPGVDQITVAGLAALDRSNMARICVGLEGRGLLRRLPDPADRRARRLSLTSEGEALLQRADPEVERVQDELLSPLRPDERTAFLSALRAIVEAHNEHSRAPQRKLEYADGAA